MKSAHTALANATNWRKSTYSPHENCVEIGSAPGLVGIRDTKLGAAASPILAVDKTAFTALLTAAKAGRFD